MGWPLLIAGLGTAGAIGLDVVQFLYNTDQNVKRLKENERYWADYKKNTGITPLYPYRAGSYVDYMGTALEANQGVVSLYHKHRRR